MVVTNSKHEGEQKEGDAFLFVSQVQWDTPASSKITRAFLLPQAALFLALGVLFSLISIPLVIYDWACSSSGDEGH